MLKNAINETLRAMPGLELRLGEPMSDHCSFRIGGPCAAMALPRSVEQLRELLGILSDEEVSPLVIGRGTNLLVTDRPLERFVIKLGDAFSGVSLTDERLLSAEAGIPLSRLAVYAKDNALSGLEFAHGIPGSLGGAVYMNAGAYGGEMKSVVRSVEYLDAGLNICRAQGEELGFSYRHSAFEGTEHVILRCELALGKGTGELIAGRMRELSDKRRASQPLELPSAGSTFKRPASGYAAAMIDEAGLKGYAVGGAMVSTKHAGFVVNTGGARFDDVIAVMDHVREAVFLRTGVTLEPEVRIIRQGTTATLPNGG